MLETQSDKFLEFNYNNNIEMKQAIGDEIELNSHSSAESHCSEGDHEVTEANLSDKKELSPPGSSPKT